MPKAVVTDGYTLDEHIPLYLRDFFYKSSYPEYTYNTTNGYGPYDFSTNGLVLYLPLFALKDSPFKSVDAYEQSCAVTGATWGPQGRTFDGINDEATIATVTGMDWGTGDFTLITWIYWEDYTNDASETAFVLLVGGSGVEWGMSFISDDHSTAGIRRTPYFYARASASATKLARAAAITKQTWYMLAGKRESDDTFVSLNGANWTAGQTGADKDYSTNPDEFDIGALSSANFHNGRFGEIWAFGATLSNGDLAHIYNSTSWRYR